jgi:hypothetical protein
LGAATKQYVDAADASISNVQNTKVNRSGDVMTGDLVLNANPSTALGAATKQYVDAADASISNVQNTKVNRSGDVMTGDLVLNANPSTALGAATKQYVDAADATKADKVTGAVSGKFAALDGSGNLTDAGKSPSDYLDKNNTTPYTPASGYNPATKKYVDDAGFALSNSFISRTTDGVSIYLPPGETSKRFGIGVTTPEAPLGISGEGAEQRVLRISPGTLTTGSSYQFSLRSPGSPGFNIEEISSSGVGVSRLFIQESTGHMSLNRGVDDRFLLGLREYSPLGSAKIGLTNTAVTSNNSGWSIGHFENGDIPDEDGVFKISEEPVVQPGTAIERITILPGGRVGINEQLPYANLHVSRPANDPQTPINTTLGSGIMMVGATIGHNLVFDNHQLQAREYDPLKQYITGDTQLGLQPLGGGVIFHENSSIASDKAIITHDARLGLGTITPTEKIDIDGAIRIGTSLSSNDGTIRYTGTDFEGRKSGAWVSLTGSAPLQAWATSGSGAIYFEPVALHAKVGIGTSTPTKTLEVYNNEILSSSNSSTSFIHSEATTSSTAFSDTRVGLEIKNSSTWSANSDARNIGIFVSDVSGQSSKEANIAAALNGNVVIGGLTSSKMVGSNGKNVLAIQTGSIPISAPGTTTNAGIQIYSDDVFSGVVSPPVSIFHLMNGDGTVIKLFRGDALSAPDNSTISTTTYGASVEAVINNMRDRINQLETTLKSLGLLN